MSQALRGFLSTQDVWYEVTYRGTRGYVHNAYLKR